MIKLMDFDVAQPGVVTIYADTKAEVPATAAALKAELEGELTDRWDSDIAAGSLIYTSSLEVGFVKGDGSVYFVGDTPPTVETVSFTVEDYSPVTGGTYSIQYIDGNNATQTATYDETDFGTCELAVKKDSEMTITLGGTDSVSYWMVKVGETQSFPSDNPISVTASDDVVFMFIAN